MQRRRYVLPWLVAGIIIIFLLMTLIVRLSGSGKDVYMDLSPGVKADLFRTEGSREEGIDPANIILRKGDKVEYQVTVPEHTSLTDPVLCFVDYNTVIDVEYRNRLLYSYGRNSYERGDLIGNVLVRVPVPEEAYGDVITVTIEQTQRTPSNHSPEFGLMAASSAWKYPIYGQEAEFFIYFAVLSGSVILLVFALIGSFFQPPARKAALLLLFGLLVCVWYMGNKRFFYMLTDQTRINAVVEYYALDFAPLPLLAYIASINHKGWFRRIYLAFFTVFAVLAAFSVTVTKLPVSMNFTDTLPIVQGCLIAFALTMLVQVIAVISGKVKASDDNRIFLYGFTAASVMAALQVLSFWIRNISAGIPGWLRSFLELDFASVGILVFLATLVYSYATRTMQEVVEEAQQEELQKLAFVDLLSGIHNRSYCVKRMQEMKKAGRQEFTVVFMDADGLKHANDVYGHETGDALIRCVADGIRECFADSSGFYGRWGGDEFVVFFDERKDADEFCGKFEDYEKKVNEKRQFPFPFSISIGLCESSEVSAPVKAGNGEAGAQTVQETAASDPTMVINEADRRMYERKRAAKKARGQTA